MLIIPEELRARTSMFTIAPDKDDASELRVHIWFSIGPHERFRWEVQDDQRGDPPQLPDVLNRAENFAAAIVGCR